MQSEEVDSTNVVSVNWSIPSVGVGIPVADELPQTESQLKPDAAPASESNQFRVYKYVPIAKGKLSIDGSDDDRTIQLPAIRDMDSWEGMITIYPSTKMMLAYAVEDGRLSPVGHAEALAIVNKEVSLEKAINEANRIVKEHGDGFLKLATYERSVDNPTALLCRLLFRERYTSPIIEYYQF